MEHRLVRAVEEALGWDGPAPLGKDFTRGSIGDPQLVTRLLTPARLLDMVMRRSLANPQFRFFKGGEELHPDAYLDRQVTPRGQAIPMAGMRRVGSLLREGATLVLDQSNVFDPTMEVTCRALQWWSREHVQANVYLTTNDASGFDLHWDDHDVLIVQLAGEKQWEVRGTSRPVPMFRDAERNNTPSEEIVWTGTMKAGDVMHIPRGYWHAATRAGRGGGHSTHVTFGFAKRTAVSWLTWLADWSRQEEVFRHDLDRWGSPEERRAQEQRLNDATSLLLDARGPAEFLRLREREAPAGRHVPFLEIFGPLEAVVCVSEFPPLIQEEQETVTVVAAGKKLTFAAKALPGLRLLLSGHPVRLDEAAQVVGAEVEALAKILVEEELCANLTPELSSGYTDLVMSA
ncbi:cupin domain-containing protein [Streptomyces sp. S1A]|uniref:cupin domain-containing protein n=1 Tax=Streptomyces sp. ICN903 TaxID=2964654 RepID=UPI001EDA69DA|nr:cupin domain-containing protein [Streptomyces sp. ICN903]MCG3039722.1 cupin domain-containing protein [Streptomyces sp. ICN903]